MSAPARPGGFTTVEVLIALVIASVLAGAVYEFLSQHRRFYGHVEAGALNNDALRVAWAVLAADLREADPASGDVVLVAPDSLRVRSPVGFGIVCDTRPANGRVALLEARGRLVPGPDSVLVHGTGGWRADHVAARNPSGPSPACSYGGGTRAVLELSGGTADLRPGAPVRAFRTWTYYPRWHDGAWWLARGDGTETQLLAGPLAPGGLRFRLLDDAGSPTADPALVVRVEIVARSETRVGAGAEPRTTSLSIAVRGRNR